MDVYRFFSGFTLLKTRKVGNMDRFLSKMTAIYIGLLFAGGVVILLGVNTVLQTYMINQKMDMLIKQASSLEKVYQKIYDPKVINDTRFKDEIVAYERYSGAKIAVVSRGGLVHSSDLQVPRFFEESEINAEQLMTVLKGNTLRKQINAYTVNGSSMVVIGYPIEIEADYPFAIFLFLPTPEIKRTAFSLALVIFVSLMLVGLCAMYLLYQSTKRINRDINRLTDAAKGMAAGDFKSRMAVDVMSELSGVADSFNHMARELERTETNKRLFISNISHDIRSPLTSIYGYAKAILDGTIPESKREHTMEIILEESERLTKLTIDMIDLSKLQSGYVPLEMKEFNINQLLIHELDKFENRILDKVLNIEIELAQESTMVRADMEGIRRVLYNLMDNAVKFVHEEGVISLHTMLFKGKIWVTIQNSSPDIPESDLEMIWKRFTKLDRSRGQERHSSGIGLAIVKEIIKCHGQSIEVTSEPGKGVTITFSLEALND